MICPKCKSENIKCTDSRPRNERNAVWRRRKCLECGHRWNTHEMPMDDIAEVVRCGNCKYFREFRRPRTKEPVGMGVCELIEMDIDVTPDFYCFYGERCEANE